MVNTTWLPPAVVVLGEMEVIDGAAGQRQDTTVASASASPHKTDDLAAVAIGEHCRQTGSDERGAGNVKAIQENRRGKRDRTTGLREQHYTPDR